MTNKSSKALIIGSGPAAMAAAMAMNSPRVIDAGGSLESAPEIERQVSVARLPLFGPKMMSSG